MNRFKIKFILKITSAGAICALVLSALSHHSQEPCSSLDPLHLKRCEEFLQTQTDDYICGGFQTENRQDCRKVLETEFASRAYVFACGKLGWENELFCLDNGRKTPPGLIEACASISRETACVRQVVNLPDDLSRDSAGLSATIKSCREEYSDQIPDGDLFFCEILAIIKKVEICYNQWKDSRDCFETSAAVKKLEACGTDNINQGELSVLTDYSVRNIQDSCLRRIHSLSEDKIDACISSTKNNKHITQACLESGKEATAAEVTACNSWFDMQESCFGFAEQLHLNPERTQACGVFIDPVSCVYLVHELEIDNPASITVCGTANAALLMKRFHNTSQWSEKERVCLENMADMTEPLSEERLAQIAVKNACQFFDDSSACEEKMKESGAAPVLAEVCGQSDLKGDLQISCIEAAFEIIEEPSINSSELQYIWRCGDDDKVFSNSAGAFRDCLELAAELSLAPDLLHIITRCGDRDDYEKMGIEWFPQYRAKKCIRERVGL